MTELHKQLERIVRDARRLPPMALAGDEAVRAGWRVFMACFVHQAELDPASTSPLLPTDCCESALAQALVPQFNRLLAQFPVSPAQLGWAFQYWRAPEKRAAARRTGRIRESDLPCLTQLFSEPYMVDFLLHNTLGAWASHRFGGKKSLPLWPCLRRHPDGRPLTGTFAQWPRQPEALRLLDPCCGAGHFLLGAFEMLVALRGTVEDVSSAVAAERVLRENLHGIEIDPECAEVARVSLRWAALRQGLHHAQPRILSLCDEASGMDTPMARAMAALGSLARPQHDTGETRWHRQAREILGQPYSLVATNVPFLARAKQSAELRDFCLGQYPEARRDLAAVFVQRCLEFCAPGGAAALVSPQNWLFLRNYHDLRLRLQKEASWLMLARLGEGGFHSGGAAGAFSALLVLSKTPPEGRLPLALWDVSGCKGPDAKAHALKESACQWAAPGEWQTPDQSITPPAGGQSLLCDFAEVHTGLQTGDNPRYVRCFWELPRISGPWTFQQGPPAQTEAFAGREQVVFWEGGAGALANSPNARVQGLDALGKRGVAVRLMRNLCATLYEGDLGDQCAAIIIPKDESDLPALWAFAQSEAFTRAVRTLDAKVNVAPATLKRIPFDRPMWRKRALEWPPLPQPQSNDPTQWLFDGDIMRSRHPLQTAVAGMLGYQWPFAAPPVSSSLCMKGMLSLCLLEEGAAPRERHSEAAECLEQYLERAGCIEHVPQWLAEADAPGQSLHQWLSTRFFRQHCKVFLHRPLIWHIWDGLRDGFGMLLNYHLLNRAALERLLEEPLAGWIARCGRAGNERKIAAAKRLRMRLEAILKGRAPYDLFVRWKPLGQQPAGWNPDLNDGLRVNIRPFVAAEVLRTKPRLQWTTDRGMESPGSPWFELFQGERRNDYHSAQ